MKTEQTMMQMLSGLVGGAGAKEPPKEKALNGSANGFEKLLHQTKNKVTEKAKKPVGADTTSSKNSQVDHGKQPESLERVNGPEEKSADISSETTEIPGEMDKAEETEKTEKTTIENDEKAKTEAEISDELLQAMGSLLQIPIELIEETLAKLELSLSDLEVPKNLQSFLMEIHGAETLGDLLDIPDIASELEAITQVLISKDKLSLSKRDEIAPSTQLTPGDWEGEAIYNLPRESAFSDESTGEAKEGQGNVASIQKESKETTGLGEASPLEPANHPFILGQGMEIDALPVTNTDASLPENRLPIDQMELMDQVVARIKVDINMDTTEMKMQLRPESLGEITLKVITENGIISAQFIAENEKVKEAIEAQMMQLEQALQDKGITVSHLEVSVGQEDREPMDHYQENRRKSSKRIHDILEDVMEVTETSKSIVSENKVDYKI